MTKYLKVWWIFAANSFQTQMMVRWTAIIFFLGKILRFSIFTFFIVILVNNTKVLAGYTIEEIILFFLTFNLIDVLSQILFREVYRFRPAVVTGTFDFYLIKPLNPLFRSLTAGPDLLDFITLFPLIGAIAYFINKIPNYDFLNILTFIGLIIIGFTISLSFHIFVLSLAILTTEIDHAIMLYRDITSLGRMPIDIYKEPIKGLLTFVIPVGIMMSFPVKSLLGLLAPIFIVYAILFSVIFFYLSLKSWQFALKRYSSASS